MIDFYLSPTQNTKAAERFLVKTLNGLKDWEKHNTTERRQVKYLNNGIEGKPSSFSSKRVSWEIRGPNLNLQQSLTKLTSRGGTVDGYTPTHRRHR